MVKSEAVFIPGLASASVPSGLGTVVCINMNRAIDVWILTTVSSSAEIIGGLGLFAIKPWSDSYTVRRPPFTVEVA